MNKFLLLGFIAIFIFGCSTTNEAPAAYKPTSIEQTGYLVGSAGVQVEGKTTSRWEENMLFFRKVGDKTGGNVGISGNIPGLGIGRTHYKLATTRGVAFAVALKPGNYEIYGVRFARANHGPAVASAENKEEFSIPFAIKAGEATYIGAFVSHGVFERTLLGIRKQVAGLFVRSDELDRDKSLILTHFPNLKNAKIKKASFRKTAPPFVVRQYTIFE